MAKNSKQEVVAAEIEVSPEVVYTLNLNMLTVTVAQVAAALMLLGIRIPESGYEALGGELKSLFKKVE